MSATADKVLKPALKLPRALRAKLASELIASLDGKAELKAREAWTAALRSRIREVRKGRVKLVEWDGVSDDIAKALRSR